MRIFLYYKDPAEKGFTMIDYVYSFKLRDCLTIEYRTNNGYSRYTVPREVLKSFEVYL